MCQTYTPTRYENGYPTRYVAKTDYFVKGTKSGACLQKIERKIIVKFLYGQSGVQVAGYQAVVNIGMNGEYMYRGEIRETLNEAIADAEILVHNHLKILREKRQYWSIPDFMGKYGKRIKAKYPGHTVYGEKFEVGAAIVYNSYPKIIILDKQE